MTHTPTINLDALQVDQARQLMNECVAARRKALTTEHVSLCLLYTSDAADE